ncbi:MULTISPECIES: phage tail domain-containing protein [Bacillota]|uniref:Phage tail family protein n=2 Tax=Bacillota TaxID=1239 RepID=A0ABY2KW68_9STAP|nr:MULTISPECIES: phage tail domain-containing protein [Bacillota]MBS5965347.1 phage tail family protein [Finegoldia magna]TGE15151.1 phage tail family protein [Staphylococcus petrasii]TKW63093.1 MAG: phage tail family protein [Gemella sp.]
MPFTIYDENLNKLQFPVGVKPLDFLVSSITKERISENVNGIPGSINYGFDYKEREITLSFWLKYSHNVYDYKLMRSELYEMLDTGEYLYIADDRLPSRILKVAIDDSYLPELVNGSRFSNLELKGTVIGLPFWRTIYTTQDIEKNGYSAIVEKFGMADGVHLDYLTYTPKTNTFSVWNGGNVTIDPRHFDLSIRLLYATAKGDVTIENLTTGEKFIFYRQFENTHLNIFGSQVLLGNTNWLRESNRKFISLVPGENKIKVSNVEHQGVSFDFPYYFK